MESMERLKKEIPSFTPPIDDFDLGAMLSSFEQLGQSLVYFSKMTQKE
jgi:hypothetical protein